MIDLTIVVPSFDTRELLLECLASIERARRAHPEVRVETIVVDNASVDGSVDAVAQRFPDVRLCALVRNRGFAAAVNRGIVARRGRHLLLLNSDVEIDPDLLADGIRWLDAQTDVGVLGASLFHPDGRPQRSVHPLPGFQTEFFPECVLRRIRPAGFARSASERRSSPAACALRRVEAVRGAVFFVRGSILEDLGLLDERFFFFLEETEFCSRVRRAGHAVAIAEDMKAVHHLGASSKRSSPLTTRIEFHRSLYRYLERERGPAIAYVARVARGGRGGLLVVAMLLASGFSSRIRRRLPERWGLLLWHLRGCPGEPRMADALDAERDVDPISESRSSEAA